MSKKTVDDSGYDRIIKYTGVFGGVQGIINLITLVKVKLVSFLLGPAGAGITEAFNRSLDMVKKTTDLGVGFSAVKTISETYETTEDSAADYTIQVVRTWCLWLAIVGTAVCFFLAPLLSRWSFDGDYTYTLSFQLLSVVVGFSSITGGEVAILKGTRQLKRIASNQLLCVVATVLVVVPLYYWMGLRGIVPALVLSGLSTMVITCWLSVRVYPYRVSLFSSRVLKDGFYIIRLGINYTLVGFLGSGAFFLISAYLISHGNAEELGCYSYGNQLVSYLSLLAFSAIDAEFFPRLSSVNKDRLRSTALVNQQIEVLVLLISPLIVAFVVFLPLLVSLVLTSKFMPAVPMAQWAVFGLFFKALTMPMSYMSLSKGDSLTFLLQELFFDLFMVVAVILGFRYGGLEGAGVALLGAGLFDWVLNYVITSVRYGFRFTRKPLLYGALQIPCFVAVLWVTHHTSGWTLMLLGLLCMALSGALSFYFLYKNTDYLQRMVSKLKNKFNR